VAGGWNYWSREWGIQRDTWLPGHARQSTRCQQQHDDNDDDDDDEGDDDAEDDADDDDDDNDEDDDADEGDDDGFGRVLCR